MTEQNLFFKYNLINTTNYEKNPELDFNLYSEKIKKIIPQSQKRWLILLHGSYACNANCIYCENHALRETYNNAIITPNIIKQIVQKLGPNTREITWHGGEPLLLDESLLKTLYDEKKKFNYDFSITLQTNSINLTPEKEQFLDDIEAHWGTSFDGLVNTKHRGEKSTKAILNLFNRKEIKPGFISVVIDADIDNLIQNYEYFKSLGVTHFQNAPVRENVIDGTNPYLIPVDVVVPKLLEYIDYWIHDINYPIHDTLIERQIKRLLGETSICEDSNCIGGWLVIDPLGNIGTCGSSPKEFNFCNINDIEDYKDLLINEKYLTCFNAQKNLAHQCEIKNCIYFPVCYGGCMGLNYEQDPTYHTINLRNCQYVQDLLNGIYHLIKNIDIKEKNKYNPLFIQLLEESNYYSLNEIKLIEEKYNG